jgi:hypothetical protein
MDEDNSAGETTPQHDNDGEPTTADNASADRRGGEDRRNLIDLVRAEAGEPERRNLGTERRDDA